MLDEADEVIQDHICKEIKKRCNNQWACCAKRLKSLPLHSHLIWIKQNSTVYSHRVKHTGGWSISQPCDARWLIWKRTILRIDAQRSYGCPQCSSRINRELILNDTHHCLHDKSWITVVWCNRKCYLKGRPQMHLYTRSRRWRCAIDAFSCFYTKQRSLCACHKISKRLQPQAGLGRYSSNLWQCRYTMPFSCRTDGR